MIIEIVEQKQDVEEIEFEDLKSGTVFEFAAGDRIGKGPKALKLCGKNYVLLSYSNDAGVGPIDLGDGSMVRHGVCKVYGKLVGIKVQA